VRDLHADLRTAGEVEKDRKIKRSQRNFITGLLATVLMQQMGSRGWKLQAMKEFFRAPQYFITPMTVRRLVFESGKLLRKPAAK
jgi:hypothetical protein